MKTLYDKLRTAQIDEQLINAFQNDSDIVYTGVIQFLSSQDFIMLTYNDYGIQDGEVYLKVSSVKSVETDSYDLANMQQRIEFDEKHHLNSQPAFDLPIKMSDSLFDRVIQTLLTNKRVSLIITEQAGKLKYNEGLISDVQEDGLTFTNINKFDFSKRPIFNIKFDDIRGIELAERNSSFFKTCSTWSSRKITLKMKLFQIPTSFAVRWTTYAEVATGW